MNGKYPYVPQESYDQEADPACHSQALQAGRGSEAVFEDVEAVAEVLGGVWTKKL